MLKIPSPLQVRRWLFSCIALLVLAHVATKIFVRVTGRDYVFGFIPMFDLDLEANIPTLYATLQILLASALAWLLGSRRFDLSAGEGAFWRVVAWVLLFMGLDEGVTIHEKVVKLVQFDNPLLFYPWVVPYIGLVLLIGALLLRGWLKLAPRPRALLAIAGVLYVGGAIGCELAASYIVTQLGPAHWLHEVEMIVEESLELCGIALVIFTQLELVWQRLPARVIAR
jgi:hypothetical protein